MKFLTHPVWPKADLKDNGTALTTKSDTKLFDDWLSARLCELSTFVHEALTFYKRLACDPTTVNLNKNYTVHADLTNQRLRRQPLADAPKIGAFCQLLSANYFWSALRSHEVEWMYGVSTRSFTNNCQRSAVVMAQLWPHQLQLSVSSRILSIWQSGHVTGNSR